MTLFQVSKIYDDISKNMAARGRGQFPYMSYIENFNKQNARYSHQTSQTCLPLQGLHSDQKDTTLYCTLIKLPPFKDF